MVNETNVSYYIREFDERGSVTGSKVKDDITALGVSEMLELDMSDSTNVFNKVFEMVFAFDFNYKYDKSGRTVLDDKEILFPAVPEFVLDCEPNEDYVRISPPLVLIELYTQDSDSDTTEG